MSRPAWPRQAAGRPPTALPQAHPATATTPPVYWPADPQLLDATAADPAAWHFEVVFDYGEHDPAVPTPEESLTWPCRVDPFSAYRAGFEVRTYRTCRRVLMFHRFTEHLGPGPVLVRSTDLMYMSDVAADPSIPAYTLLDGGHPDRLPPSQRTGHRVHD